MISIAQTYARCGLSPSVAQSAFVKSVLGEPLDSAELECWRACTGRADYPQSPFQEADGLCGRKSGKTEYIAALILVHRASTDTDTPGVYLLVSPSKSDQSRIGWQAILRLLQRGFPGLIAEVKEGEGRIYLHNGNVIAIASANFRTLRGPKYKVVVIDEACFYYSDDPAEGGANPLEFILDSVVGGMIATEYPLLLLLSTPWNRSGVVFVHFRDRDTTPDRMCWRAPTLVMNPHANQELMERHKRDRGANFYNREYLAEFSEDSFAYLNAADIDAALAPESMPFFPPRPGAFYSMGLDPGRLRDHFGAAIAHREGDAVVVSWCKEWKPGIFGLKYADILPEIWEQAREYGIRKIASDQVDFGGIQASIPTVNGTPEFEMERVMTGGQSGAELADVTRALFAQRKLILPNQAGLADEFKRLGDFLSQGGSRDIRAKKGADDRSRACMLAIHQAWTEPPLREPLICVLNLNERETHDKTDCLHDESYLHSRAREAFFFRRRGASFR
jgi:hypothetical protein